VRKLSADYPVALVNSVNPERLQGQKTASFEIVDALGDAPDVHCLPVGNAGNIAAYWLGYREYLTDGRATKTPRMLGYQAAGAAPIVLGRPVLKPVTVATAIRIGNPARLEEATAAVRESNGAVRAMPDDRILSAYRLLAQEEGVFCEPASAASVGALLVASADGLVEPGSTVVCVLTGHGLKDPDTAGAEGAEILRCPPHIDRLEELAFAREAVLA
jgi:threonine synthase